MTSFLDQCRPEDLRRLSARATEFSGNAMRRAHVGAQLAGLDPERFQPEDKREAVNEANELTFIAGLLRELADRQEGGDA